MSGSWSKLVLTDSKRFLVVSLVPSLEFERSIREPLRTMIAWGNAGWLIDCSREYSPQLRRLFNAVFSKVLRQHQCHLMYMEHIQATNILRVLEHKNHNIRERV